MLNQNFQPKQFSDLVFEDVCVKQRLCAYASGKRDGKSIEEPIAFQELNYCYSVQLFEHFPIDKQPDDF